ncbi:MAG: acetyl-CoA carboxylase biotin carboxyl carrier protein subunit [Thermodesulfobacteriota bacterium]|nr:acetyl-CoA carboxylase biotin carboxyl carrier protein subunit [Thermodesulfobacteriota bacterium]
MNNLKSSEVVRIKANMVGTVVDMNPSLRPGMHMREGDELLTLERMKLFCTVSAPCTGVVTAVMAEFGSRVLEGEILLEMEVQGR